MADSGSNRNLGRSLALITAGGCLAQIYVTCIQSPVATEFFRQLGASKLQFGFIAGVPLAMLGLQFLGAFLTNRLRHRKPWFLASVIGGRLLYLGIAFLPMLLPNLPPEPLVWLIILLIAIHHLVVNMTLPLWFSWMGDLIPARILGRYWGRRHQIMTAVWTLAYLTIALLTWKFAAWPVTRMFQMLVVFGVVGGVIDILLFAWVDEPPNTVVTGRHPLDVLTQPLRDRQYRSFILFTCCWMFAAMFAAAFMQLYVLESLRIPLWQTNLIWCTAGIGSAMVGGLWGRTLDRHGTRPILILISAGKPMIVIVFLLIDARTALVALPIAFFIDSMFNAGQQVSNSGYMLKQAPVENRSMFIASSTALTGFAGGLGAFLGGWLLDQLDGVTFAFAGHLWINFHLLFAISAVLRLIVFGLAFTIREPASSPPVVILTAMVGSWPMRMLLFPVGLYRRLVPGRPDDDNADA